MCADTSASSATTGTSGSAARRASDSVSATFSTTPVASVFSTTSPWRVARSRICSRVPEMMTALDCPALSFSASPRDRRARCASAWSGADSASIANATDTQTTVRVTVARVDERRKANGRRRDIVQAPG